MNFTNKRTLLVMAIIFLVVASCRLPIIGDISNVNPQVLALHLVTPNPGATATLTPFQPRANTPTPIASPTPPLPPTSEYENYPGAPQAPELTKPDGLITILLLGSDYRPSAGYRTDVIMLAFLNPKLKTVNMVSFPRDLWVYIPGWQMQRINTAFPHGGFSIMQATLEYNLGVKPDYYLLTNFDGFKGIVDSLGGIEVNTAKKLSDSCEIPLGTRTRWCSVGPGMVHMNGEMALWYVRSRNSTSDYDRERRAQEVIQALFLKLMSINAVTRAPELYGQFKAAVDTNLGLADILTLLPLASQIGDTNGVGRYTITTDHVTPWITPGGGYVQLIKIDAIQAVLKKAMGIQ